MRFEPFTVIAPAKINLFLHITGRRADGYHLLHSLIVFADAAGKACDRLDFAPAEQFSLTVTGDFAAALQDADPQQNLITRAAEMLCGSLPPVGVTLVKQLPVGAGIGGGSTDAAACLTGLSRLLQKHIPVAAAAKLGADIPACLAGKSLLASGIGEELRPVTLPRFALLLVHPGKALSTPEVFRNYAVSSPVFNTETPLPDRFSFDELVNCVTDRGNDLQTAAMSLIPDINNVIIALENQPSCLSARMSGSGATCFGIFTNDEAAQEAEQNIRAAHPLWWCANAKTFS